MIDDPEEAAGRRGGPGRQTPGGRDRLEPPPDGARLDAVSFDDAGVHGGDAAVFDATAFDAAAPAPAATADAAPSASDIASRIAAEEADAAPHPALADAAPTPIDLAWRKAMAAQDSADASTETAQQLDLAAADFIDALLSETLFCPVWDLEGSDEDSLAPKMVERDGVDTLVLFDTEERLAAFASEPTDFVELPGRAFFRLVAGQGAQIALNPDVAPSATVFSSETIDAIAELADAIEEETELMPDGPLTVLSPDDAPDPLLRSLAARLSAADAVVSEAWLFTAVQEMDPAADPGEDEAAAEDPEEFRQLVVGLAPREPRRADALQDLASELNRIGSAASPAPFAVALFEAEDRLLGVARSVGLDLAGRPGAPTRAA